MEYIKPAVRELGRVEDLTRGDWQELAQDGTFTVTIFGHEIDTGIPTLGTPGS